MTLYKLSINRPVLATVFSLAIVLFGIISYTRLPVREYPAVDPPVITVTTNYPGAPPEVIESQITEPLEESINAVAGILTMRSVSREGRSTITVEFGLDMDIEAAANDVRDRVAQARRTLPVDADPPVVVKADADSFPVVMLAISSDRRDLLELSDLADRRFKAVFETIPGVSRVDIWGEKRYAMRLWLDRSRMAAHGITPSEVRDALDRENVELPSGRIDGDQVELSVRTISRFTIPDQFNEMVIRQEGGRTVRLQDIGYATIGPQNQRTLLKVDGVPAVAVVLRPQPGANQIEMVDEFYRRWDDVKRELPPDINTFVGFDTSQFIRDSIAEVRQTLIIAFSLVLLIIFLFLRSVRTTVIPAIAIPVSLIGGFFIMWAAGFSINVLTLLALVLAIGLVVDDAIVVMENIYKKIESGMPLREAAEQGTREVFFAIIATTLALVSVFLPILFIGGITGQLFREFGVVIGGTVLISSFVALTLSPMLCSKILGGRKRSEFHSATEPFFEGLNAGYQRSVSWFLDHRWLAFPVLAIAGVLATVFFRALPAELAPLEDRSRMRVFAVAPEGTGYDFMQYYMDSLSGLIAEEAPESAAIISVTSPGFGATSAINTGFIRLILVPPGQRERSQQEILRDLSQKALNLPAARVFISQDPTISTGGGGGGSGLPVQFVIQGANQDALREALPDFFNKVEDSPVFTRADVDLKFNQPELRVEIDRERAQALGVSARDIGDTLNLGLSEQRFGYFLREGKQYEVIGQLVREHRNENIDLNTLKVPSSTVGPVRLDSVVTFEETASPPQLFRFNRYASATVSTGLAEGYSLGDGIEEMQRIAGEVLDDRFRTDLAGESRDFRDSAASLEFVFLLALVMIYLVLAAQFESFRDPLTIMLTVPLALCGALGMLFLASQSLNVFSQIGLIMLVGLVTKNGILIVEFANQRKAAGLPPLQAVREAAALRFRPVLMTSLSTILGITPIALALGAGAESRKSMGLAIIGGMVIGSLLTLYVIPAMYSYISSRRTGWRETDEAVPPAAGSKLAEFHPPGTGGD